MDVKMAAAHLMCLPPIQSLGNSSQLGSINKYKYKNFKFLTSIASSSTTTATKTKKVSMSGLGFWGLSQLSGFKLSISQWKWPPSLYSTSQTILAKRVCPFTGKKSNKANKISYSNHKTKRRQFVNLQYKKLWWEAGKRFLRLRLSTNAIRTIEKNGLDAVAKKAGINLSRKK